MRRKKSSPPRDSRKLPERLRKKLIGELVLAYDRNFPVHLNRIAQIDERLGRILSELIFLCEDLEKLPDHIRGPILNAITDGNERLADKLFGLYRHGSELQSLWLDTALDLAEVRLARIFESLKTLESLEREKD